MNAIQQQQPRQAISGDVDALLSWFFPIRVRGVCFDTENPFLNPDIAAMMDGVLDMRKLVGKDESEIRCVLRDRLSAFAIEILVCSTGVVLSDELAKWSFDELMAIYCQYARAYKAKTAAIFGGAIGGAGGGGANGRSPATSATTRVGGGTAGTNRAAKVKPATMRAASTRAGRGVHKTIVDATDHKVFRKAADEPVHDDHLPPDQWYPNPNPPSEIISREERERVRGVDLIDALDPPPDQTQADESAADDTQADDEDDDKPTPRSLKACHNCHSRMVRVESGRFECSGCGKVVTA